MTIAASGADFGPPRRFDLTIRKGRIAGELKTIRLTQGETIELNWYSDEPGVLHLHGYDIEIAVAPGAPAKMRINAHAAGRYPIAAHSFGSHAAQTSQSREMTLLYLEVHPR